MTPHRRRRQPSRWRKNPRRKQPWGNHMPESRRLLRFPPDNVATPLHDGHKSHMAFQERLARERRRQDPEPSRS